MFSAIAGSFSGGKFVSVHSRKAHQEIVKILEDEGLEPVCFHYFTGGGVEAKEIAEQGHFFSVNRRMLRGRHQDLIRELPKHRILVESDGPFLSKAPLSAVKDTYAQISKIWGMDFSRVETLISNNFENCRTK